jgi:hypothetical protein
MNPASTFTRPPLPAALDVWSKLLAERSYSTDLLWIFEENLCFEKSPSAPGGFKLGFQTQFAPPPAEALDMAYEHFCESAARIVFYRLGGCQGRSLCLVLGDEWLESRGAADGYCRRDDWRMSFYPGRHDEIEEVTDMQRWLRRLKRGRPLHDLDFSMTLAAIEEMKFHGRVLAPYERFAGQILGKLRRLFAHAK